MQSSVRIRSREIRGWSKEDARGGCEGKNVRYLRNTDEN